MEIIPFSEQEIQQFRADTRGTAERIHFNNAGASLPPDVVVRTVIDYLNEEAACGGYETESKYSALLENTYASIARLINADIDEVAIMENASIGWGLAFNGITFEPGDVILTSEMEYVTNLIGLLNVRQEHGVEIRVIPNDEQGNFVLSALEEAISPQTRLIAMTQISSSAGGMIPVVEIGRIARKHNILYLVDGCQSIGQVPVDVRAIDCDMLSVTGRKYLRGPRGTGFLYVRKEVQDKLKLLFMDGFSAPAVSFTALTAGLTASVVPPVTPAIRVTPVGGQGFTPRNDARRFELYEKNRALTLGLGAAVDYVLRIGADRIWQRVQSLAGLMRQQLAGIEGITVHDTGDQKCGIVTFSVDGLDSTRVKNELAAQKINVSVGKAISTLIYMDKNHLVSIVRASVHYYNTEGEVRQLCDAVRSIQTICSLLL